MKVVLGSHYFFPHIGGIESVVESHAERLAGRGHDVTVVSSNAGADSFNSRQDGYKVRRFKAWNPTESFGVPYPVPSPIDAGRKLRDTLEDREVDLVHVHGLNYLTTTAILRHVPSSTPVVMHQHTPFVEYPFPIQQIEQVNDHLVGRWNLRQANLVFCINPNIEQYVQKLEPSTNTELLMNGVDTEFFNPRRGQEASPFNCDSDATVLFTLSRMSQKKGIDVLLEAIQRIGQESMGIHFAVAGDGPMRGEVEKIAQKTKNMEIMGRLTDNELASCYAAADAFVFTSKSGEAFPTLTMIEALSSGTPVIASELAENPIGVRDRTNSILFEPGDAGGLINAITEMATDRNHLPKMSEKAREAAEKQFSIEDRIDQLEMSYESLIELSN
ncbi:glycosyltransferase family 4 protein [Haloarchaeobius sp. HRN-SO-5]|uniref:glycosyltransferase family 4 protein n=1 Tax=Haloarchaeobius sp. HRN-SO-5 TaxID=3446118 RepID=UPI003EBA25A5